MDSYPSSVKTLINNLMKIPTVGEKTAERLTMYILKQPSHEIYELARSIASLKKNLTVCSSCFSFSDAPVCNICSNTSRAKSIVCVVEQPADMVSLEKSGSFKGVYHVLGGLISPMNGMGPDNIRIKELLDRVRRGNIVELIIATGTSLEGESTASYISRCLDPKIRVTRIASGVPMGGDLKYLDQVTLKRAMEGRYDISYKK